MAVRIQHRRDTAANWTSANPILADGEMGIEQDTRLFKMGDGSTAWNSLAYGGIKGEDGAVGQTGGDNIDGGTAGTVPIPAYAIDGGGP